MNAIRKILLTIITLSFTLNVILSEKVNQLKLLNLEYPRGEIIVKYAMKYEKLSIEHDLTNEPDINSLYFRYIWEFSTSEEKQKAEAMVADIKNDFDIVSNDDSKVSITFQAKDILNIKLYKKNEFGSAFVLECDQKGNKVQLQFQIPKDQLNQDDLHDLIVKVIDSKKVPVEALLFLQ
jgi:hypothetical protein